MTKDKVASSITAQIDNDDGLKSKRKMLTIVSVITLAMTFSAAKIEEVNTLFFKLSFENNGGISFLLVCSILFLLIRYFNYARPYHDKLYRVWSDRMLKAPFFYVYHYHNDECEGLVKQKMPKGIDFYEHMNNPELNLTWGYECSFPLKRKISYRIFNQDDDWPEVVSIGWQNYPKALILEVKHRLQSLFIYRENLDIYTPYFLGLAAISSYFFVEELQQLLTFFVVE
jgi:hypothetical protein